MLIDGLPNKVFVVSVRPFSGPGRYYKVFMSKKDAFEFVASINQTEDEVLVYSPVESDFVPSQVF